MFRTRLPFLAGAATVLLLALIGGLASAAPGFAPGEPTDGAPASAAGAGGPNADPLTESGRWEWAGGGTLNDIFFVDSTYGWAAGTGVWKNHRRRRDAGVDIAHSGRAPRSGAYRLRRPQPGLGLGARTTACCGPTDGGETWVSLPADSGGQPTRGSAGCWQYQASPTICGPSAIRRSTVRSTTTVLHSHGWRPDSWMDPTRRRQTVLAKAMWTSGFLRPASRGGSSDGTDW